MMDVSDSEMPPLESESAPKKKKGKKRPSDFEIVRTILQRTHERKLPYLLRNMGEDPDILFFCSEDEKGFTYGSPDLTVAIFEFTDPELKTMVETCLGKIHGAQQGSTNQCIVNVRDQISELAKTKGESMDVEVASNAHGSHWCVKKDTRGQERILYFAKAIDSLFHMQMVKTWCEQFRPLLTTESPEHLYYPYQHPHGKTATILTIPSTENTNHPITAMYPNGFRAMVTRGLDVIIDKGLDDLPYPVVSQDMIVFQDQGVACKMAHRLVGEGWRMVLVRPNCIFFPTLTTPLPFLGNHSL